MLRFVNNELYPICVLAKLSSLNLDNKYVMTYQFFINHEFGLTIDRNYLSIITNSFLNDLNMKIIKVEDLNVSDLWYLLIRIKDKEFFNPRNYLNIDKLVRLYFSNLLSKHSFNLFVVLKGVLYD